MYDDVNTDLDPIGGAPVDADPVEPTDEHTGSPGWLTGGVGGLSFEVYDVTGDHVVDVAVSQLPSGEFVVLSDENSDGDADAVAVDLDGDGIAELLVSETADGYVLRVDENEDGIFEHELALSPDQLVAELREVADLFELWFDGGADPVADTTTQWVEDGQLVGDPVGDAEYWFTQAANGLCVPASVAQIVAEYTGEPFADESAFVDLANEHGLFVVGMDGVPGMTIDGAHELLELAGVPAQLVTEAGLDTLETLLADGHSIMLFVDSGEYWHGEASEDDTPDHAVVLTGIDHERGVAILSDPGIPDGNALEVPLDTFLDAWADSYNTMLVSEQPAPDLDVPYGPADLTGTRPRTDVGGIDTAAALDSGGTGTDLGEYLQAEPTQIERVTSWVVDHPWVVIPVAIGLRTLLSSRSS